MFLLLPLTLEQLRNMCTDTYAAYTAYIALDKHVCKTINMKLASINCPTATIDTSCLL